MERANPAAILVMMLFLIPVLVCIARARRGQKYTIRRISGVDAIDEALGRSVEVGRPVVFTTGLLGIGPALYACLGVLRHVARRCATFGSRLLVPCIDPETMALTDATVQEAYRDVRKSSRYDPTSVRFLSSGQFAYASGYMGLVHRENAASAFLFGAFAAESLILAEAGQQVGAVQVAATVSNEQIPFFVTTCDYTLIGEELFAAGAYLSGDPVQTGSIRGQDIAKVFLLILLVVGISLTTISSFRNGKDAPSPLGVALDASWSDVLPKWGHSKPEVAPAPSSGPSVE